jgi:prephenate dehydrogenase
MRLALIGVGLIGGSFALAARAAGKVTRVVGFDNDSEALRRASELGVIDEAASSAAQAVENAGLVMIATPIGSIRLILRAIAPRLASTAIVTDVGSAKAGVIKAACEELGAAFPRFVPGHPIAGSERSGVEHSHAALFRDRIFIATPVAQTGADAVHCVEALWRDVGCVVERLAPEQHDSVFAAVSHLPHLLAFALVAHIASQTDAEQKFTLAGAGFRDFTRIASSSPTMWRDICIANSDAIGLELSRYRNLLAQLQEAVERRDAETLERAFTQSASVIR